jgi:uncharacterized membrane-anchored protein YitT (DUF2179 family)
MNRKKVILDILIITLGTAVVAGAVYFFMLPSQVSVGSVSSFAMVLKNFLPLPVSMITLTLNAVLLLVGYLLIGKEFIGKTVFGSLLLPAFLALYEFLFPNFQSLTQDATLDVLCYILVVSAGQALVFSRNASTGGVEIIGKVINKYFHMELGQAMAAAGMVMAMSSALCYDSKTVILSLLGTYFGGIVVDNFIFGLNIKRKVCILSSRTDEIVDYILHELHSGASLYEAVGAYDKTVRREINVIVDKQEYRALMDYLHRVDPKAFVTVYSVNEMNYTPKK